MHVHAVCVNACANMHVCLCACMRAHACMFVCSCVYIIMCMQVLQTLLLLLATLFIIIVHIDGYTYERSAIVSWLSEGRSTSPMTNLPFPHTNLVPNKTLKQHMDSQCSR